MSGTQTHESIDQVDQQRPNGYPRFMALVKDGITAAITQPVSTITAAVVVAIVCFIILATAGQSAANEQRIMSRIDGVGTRLIALSDDGGKSGLRADAIDVISTFSDVSWSFALGPVQDVQNLNYPTDERGVAARDFYGHWPEQFELVAGRMPQAPGEALAGITAAEELHLADGTGTVVTKPTIGLPDGNHERTAVVGVFQTSGTLDRFNSSVLVQQTPTPDAPILYVYVMANDVSVVERLGETLTEMTPVQNPGALTIEVPQGALDLRKAVAGELGSSARALMALVLGVGVAIVTVTMLGAVSSRRRDFGRRRALGATRSSLIALVLIHTAVAAVAGCLLGLTAGLITVQIVAGSLPAFSFVAAVAGLCILVALLGALVPALAAAYRDPMRILRVP